MRFVEGAFDDDAAFEKLRAPSPNSMNAVLTATTPSTCRFPEGIRAGAHQLAEHGLASRDEDTVNPVDGWRRVVIEKPFGHNLKAPAS